MFKLILFHPGIGTKQKLYLFYTYCFCYYIDWFMYFVEKYFIELDKKFDDYLRVQKIWKIYKRKKKYNKSWLKILSKSGKKGAKAGRKLKRMITPTKKAQKKLKFYGIDYKSFQKEKDELYSHIIKNNLGPQDANKILKVAGILGNSGIDLLDYVKTNIDFIYWYKNQSEEIKKKISLYEYDNEKK